MALPAERRAGSSPYRAFCPGCGILAVVVPSNALRKYSSETIVYTHIGGPRFAGDSPKRFEGTGLQYHVWRRSWVLRTLLRRRLLSRILFLPSFILLSLLLSQLLLL